jgi:hypothetical protein
MSLTALFSSLATATTAAAASAALDYHELVLSLADHGAASIQADRVLAVLAASGRTAEDLRADIALRQEYMALAERAANRAELERASQVAAREAAAILGGVHAAVKRVQDAAREVVSLSHQASAADSRG